MNYFAPRMRPIPPPCGRNCPDRSGTCRAGCCTWTLYETIRTHIYAVNHRDRDSLQPDLAAGKQMVHARISRTSRPTGWRSRAKS